MKNLIETATSAGTFGTLITAVKAAGLVDLLNGPGPFTVFAPTDDAFKKIPKETLDKLLADKDALSKILTYHVVPGKVMAAQVTGMTSAKSAQGQSIKIDTSHGVTVDESKVTATDIEASNGVIHVIDSVMMPS